MKSNNRIALIRETANETQCSGAALLGIPNGFGQFYRFAAAEMAPEGLRSRAISYVLAGGVIAAFAGPNLDRWSKQLLPDEFAGSYASLIANLWLRRKPHRVDPEPEVPL